MRSVLLCVTEAGSSSVQALSYRCFWIEESNPESLSVDTKFLSDYLIQSGTLRFVYLHDCLVCSVPAVLGPGGLKKGLIVSSSLSSWSRKATGVRALRSRQMPAGLTEARNFERF